MRRGLSTGVVVRFICTMFLAVFFVLVFVIVTVVVMHRGLTFLQNRLHDRIVAVHLRGIDICNCSTLGSGRLCLVLLRIMGKARG